MFFSATDLQFAKIARIDIGEPEVILPARMERDSPDPEWNVSDWRSYAEQLEDDVESVGRDRDAARKDLQGSLRHSDSMRKALFLCACVITAGIIHYVFSR